MRRYYSRANTFLADACERLLCTSPVKLRGGEESQQIEEHLGKWRIRFFKEHQQAGVNLRYRPAFQQIQQSNFLRKRQQLSNDLKFRQTN
jgi:hypothetical protein